MGEFKYARLQRSNHELCDSLLVGLEPDALEGWLTHIVLRWGLTKHKSTPSDLHLLVDRIA